MYCPRLLVNHLPPFRWPYHHKPLAKSGQNYKWRKTAARRSTKKPKQTNQPKHNQAHTTSSEYVMRHYRAHKGTVHRCAFSRSAFQSAVARQDTRPLGDQGHSPGGNSERARWPQPMCPCRTSCKRGSWVFLGNAFQSASRSRQSTFWCGKSQKYSRRGHGRSPGALCRAHEEENVSASAPRRQRDPCGDHGYSRGAHFRWHRQTDRDVHHEKIV